MSLIINYMICVDYLLTSWFFNFVFILPIMIASQLIFMYKTIKIDFNYQLNNIAIVLVYVYLAVRHYSNFRVELENFVTLQENDNLRK